MQVVADRFGAGIDDTHIKMRGAPVLEEASLSSHQKMIADKLSVSELMTMALVALPPVARVGLMHRQTTKPHPNVSHGIATEC